MLCRRFLRSPSLLSFRSLILMPAMVLLHAMQFLLAMTICPAPKWNIVLISRKPLVSTCRLPKQSCRMSSIVHLCAQQPGASASGHPCARSLWRRSALMQKCVCRTGDGFGADGGKFAPCLCQTADGFGILQSPCRIVTAD